MGSPHDGLVPDVHVTDAFGEFHPASLELLDVPGMDRQRPGDVILEGVFPSMPVPSITAALSRCSSNQRTILGRDP